MPGGPEIEALKALAQNSQLWADWSTFAVFIGLLGEIAITFAYAKDKPRSEIVLGVICGVIIAVGVYGEWRFGSKAAQANGELRRLSEEQLAHVTMDVGNTHAAAKDAADAAARAKDSAKEATNEAGNAKTVAAKAELVASGARQEADSFERDIVSAKAQAASAESHLADALERAATATGELHRLESPRSLTGVQNLALTLSALKGTEYAFESVYGDDESLELLRQIDGMLRLAGWKRQKKIGINLGIPAFQIYPTSDPKERDLVDMGVGTGLHIVVDSSLPLEAIHSTPIDKLPTPVRAAILLNEGIFHNLYPPEDIKNLNPTEIDPRASASKNTIRIAVGKKPY